MDIRPSAIAGSWYPGEPTTLREMVVRFLDQAEPPEISGKVWGLVVPHAGYQYSGAIAAKAFSLLRDHPAIDIVIFSPYHDYHAAPFLTSAHQAYCTPFGAVEIHQSLLAALDDQLRGILGEGLTPISHDREHALEIELPFLQHVIGDFRLLPIMLRTRDARLLHGLAQVLAQLLAGQDALYIASSDLSHFYSQEQAQKLDTEMLHRVEAFEPERVLSAEAEGVGYACGAGAIAAALWGAQEMGADRVSVTGYATSGDVSGDYRGVVGYGSAVIWQQKPSHNPGKTVGAVGP